MAFQFRQDMQKVAELMAWNEWRVNWLKDHGAFHMMVQVSRANPQYHGLFHEVRPEHEENQMIRHARSFSNVLLHGVAGYICSDVSRCYGCSAVKPVGDALEGLLWFGLMENPGNSEACQLAREFYWLARDVREVFLIGQKYNFWTCPNYDWEQLQEVIRKLRAMEVGMAPPRGSYFVPGAVWPCNCN